MMFFKIMQRTGRRSYATATLVNEGDLEVTLQNGVKIIKFNRPQKKNAITRQMAEITITQMEASNNEESTKLVVLTGEGDYFTSGIDLSSGFSKPDSSPPPPSDVEPKKPKSLKLVKTLIDLKKPLIACVNGPSHGIGVTMLGLCDVVYCSDKAHFITNFTKFGLPPECCSTFTFPRIMGYAKANELLTFCNKLTAHQALQAGLVSSIFPHEDFIKLSMERIVKMAELPLKSILYTKELIRATREREILHQTHRAEQEKFDIGIARIVKQNFAQRKQS